MNLRQLRSFVAVAQTRNVTRAAALLGIAQPPLSRQIIDLEVELGVTVFDRSVRPIALTEAGWLLLDHAEKLLASADRLREAMRAFGAGHRSRFVIGFVGSAIYGPIPALIRRFRDAAPDMDVELVEMNTVAQIRALEDGRIDAGIGRLMLESDRIQRRVLQQEPLVMAVPLGHRLSEVDHAVPLSMIRGETLILYPSEPRPSYADQVLSILRAVGLTPTAIREVRELQTALGLVAADGGVTLVPESILRLQRPDVRYLTLDAPDAVSPIVLSWRRDDASVAISILADISSEALI